MKIYPFLFILFLVSCKDAIKNEIEPVYLATNLNFENAIINDNLIVNTETDLIGNWVGEMYDENNQDVENEISSNNLYLNNNKVVIVIENVKENKLKGHTFIDGKISPFSGSIVENINSFLINISDKNKLKLKRSYNLSISKGDTNLTGVWNVLDNKKKKFLFQLHLEKKTFQYNPNYIVNDGYVDSDKTGKGYREYKGRDSLGKIKVFKREREGYFATTDTVFKLNSSVQLFEKDLVENLSKADLYILRNSIYARHGFIFKEQKLRAFFTKFSWYFPVKYNVLNELTKIENIDLIQRYEQNAKVYYQVFGR